MEKKSDTGFGMDGKKSDPGWKEVGSGKNIPDLQHWILISGKDLIEISEFCKFSSDSPKNTDPVLFTKCCEEPSFSEADDAADSDTETDILETVKPLSPDSREDESYRYYQPARPLLIRFDVDPPVVADPDLQGSALV